MLFKLLNRQSSPRGSKKLHIKTSPLIFQQIKLFQGYQSKLRAVTFVYSLALCFLLWNYPYVFKIFIFKIEICCQKQLAFEGT